jgi:phage antirepressor YoqD-like protein
VGRSAANSQELGGRHTRTSQRNIESALADPVSRNIVFLQGSEAVTTSLAIAEGTQVEHRAVIQLVRAYQADLEEFGPLAFQMRVVKRPQGGGTEMEFAHLNEQQATLIMTYMKNSDIVRSFKKGLVKAFFEIAKQLRDQNARDPMDVLRDPLAMRGLLLNYSEKVLVLETKISEQAPKVAALDRLCTPMEGAMCVRDAAKVLRLPEKMLFRWLSSSEWIYRRPGKANWLAYSPLLQRGLLEHKMYSVDRGNGQEPSVHMSLLITSKGMALIAKEFQTQLTQPGDEFTALPIGGEE